MSNWQLNFAFNRFKPINNLFRCRPRRTSKRSPTGSEDYAATPDMDIVCSVVGSITPPSIDFDFGVEASPDAELIEPVAEELIVPRNSSPLATEQVESILVATAASVLSEPGSVLSFHSFCALTSCPRPQGAFAQVA